MFPFAPHAWPSPERLVIGLLILAGILLVLLQAHLWYWDKKLGLALEYAEVERLPTPDGSVIELRRVQSPAAEGETAVQLPPVLLVHGLGANHRNQDAHPDFSLARFLTTRGRDVWLVTLRSGVRPRTRVQTRLVRFSNMVREDLPIAIAAVLERTGQAKLDYVGFSMGGMLLYAALARTVAETLLRRVVIIGSPAMVRAPFAVPFASRFRRMPVGMSPHMRLRLWARTAAFAAEWLHTPLHHALFNPKNVKKGITRVALANLIEDIPGPLNWDFVLWALSDKGHLTLDGEDVLERLSAVRVPALFFAGACDRLAPPASVRLAFEAWGAAHADVHKEFVLLARKGGAHEDYGHGDMAVGEHVREDIFEPLTAFLAAPDDDTRTEWRTAPGSSL